MTNPLFKNAKWIVQFNSQKYLENGDKDNPYNWELAIQLELNPSELNETRIKKLLNPENWRVVDWNKFKTIMDKYIGKEIDPSNDLRIKPTAIYFNRVKSLVSVVGDFDHNRKCFVCCGEPHDPIKYYEDKDSYLMAKTLDIEPTKPEDIENYEKLQKGVTDD